MDRYIEKWADIYIYRERERERDRERERERAAAAQTTYDRLIHIDIYT